MEQLNSKQSRKDELEIKKAPEELTEKDLKMVAGGKKLGCKEHESPNKCPGNSL